MPAGQRMLLDSTILHDYYFVWDDDTAGEARIAVALGLVSLCNHSRRPSARVRPNRTGETLDLIAMTPIAAGREITIDYNCPLWFAAADLAGSRRGESGKAYRIPHIATSHSI